MIFRSDKVKTPEKNYFPASVGLMRPAEQNVIEFLVIGRKEKDCQNKILEFLAAHGTELISHYGYSNEDASEFILSTTVDCKRIVCSLDELLIRLRKMKFVTRAEKSDLKGQLFSNFLFPIKVLGARSVNVETDSLGAIDDALRAEGLGKVSKLLFDEGRNNSIKVYDSLRRLEMSEGAKPVTEAIKGYLRASGWGIFNFRLEGEFAFATISDPPTMGPNDSSISGISYLSGLAAGVIERMIGSKVHFRYGNYEKERQMLTLCMGKLDLPVVTPAVSNVGQVESEEELTPNVPANGLVGDILRDLGSLSVLERILVSAKRGALKVSLMNTAKVSHSEAGSLLEELQKRGLLEARKDEKVGTTFYSTPRGDDFVDICQRLSDLLVEAPRARIKSDYISKSYR
jgi:predicted transcriptional regulator